MRIEDLPSPVVIHLESDKHRQENISRQISNWCLKHPLIFSAYSGKQMGVPSWFKAGAGAWGCRLSHLELMAKAIQSDLPVFILEDDFLLAPDFTERLDRFLSLLPDDWDGIWLGGEHGQRPQVVNTEVVRCTCTYRNHAYLMRGHYLRDCWASLQNYPQHIDWLTGAKMNAFRVYAPTVWLEKSLLYHLTYHI